MNGYSLLEHTLRNILCSINPLDEDWSMRFQLIDELRAMVENIESLRGATVEPFGSFVSNLFTRWGDLDISIELPNGSYISSAGKKYKLSLLEDVRKALKAKGGCRKLQFITNARVPILKFQGNYNISCDISINNLSGQMKSKILYWINMIDGRFRDMVLLVKEWAKAHNINDSKAGTLNSYSLSLLVVFHFQTCVPAILPPLKEIYPGNMVDDLTGVRASAEKFIEETCATNINQLMSKKSRAINKSSLSELFISFIAKFCNISSKASAQGISPFTGQWEDIEGNMRWLPKTYTIFVEDPFEQPANAARGVSSKQLTRIEEAFRRTHFMLISSNQNQNEVISTLVKPHVSKFVARTPTGIQNNYSRNGLRPQVQAQRAIKPPLQVQHQLQAQRAIPPPMRAQHQLYAQRAVLPPIQAQIQLQAQRTLQPPIQAPHQLQAQRPIYPPFQAHRLQDKRLDRNQNSSAQRPTQANRVQTQPIWRPKSDR
ncbi:PREDICTED: protein HESO1 [Nicotiana attenuata]|uniref:Protein heso1 n=1 Tax=Nicotiana attenuata TaxID=49451 RepID=A0A314LAH1_NICAT|nr:PREDICTED: protein HESO1 [Nicotiana attenuata]XP_019261294.1 PREDICTED: protein HESO1 [Nicotiana attenuata]XP_019261296.1 PREDICTED: protein HESO1 [Nicotiana attenuata]XP_019261297.1 PREDICTED: protein HESO1 [Nicotiana attenuata]OIT38582.1 protein heso1 [Nicotiana attenuata]